MPDDFDVIAQRFAAEATTWPPRPEAIAALLRQTVKDEKLRIATRVRSMDNGCGAAYIAERIEAI